MTDERAWSLIEVAASAALILGAVGCAIGAAASASAFYRAWLCAYIFWLGVPLGAVTLILVHDLTGGAWMASARPTLAAAATTMPVATLAGIPVLLGLRAVYPWPGASGLGNAWYLNTGFFILRYAIDLVLWNGIAAYALWAPRGVAVGVEPGLRWLSAVGLILLAYTASFAPITWVIAVTGFFVPFSLLLWRKRRRLVVIAAGVLILVSRVIESWWLVLPELPQRPPLWLDLAAMLALGGLLLLLFLRRLRFGALS